MFYARFVLLFIIALLASAFFYYLKYNYTDTFNKAGFIYYCINQYTYINLFCTLLDKFKRQVDIE